MTECGNEEIQGHDKVIVISRLARTRLSRLLDASSSGCRDAIVKDVDLGWIYGYLALS